MKFFVRVRHPGIREIWYWHVAFHDHLSQETSDDKEPKLTLLLASFFLTACASSPSANGFSQVRPASIDCRRVAPTATKLKTKTVCGTRGGGQSVSSRKAHDGKHNQMDPLGTRHIYDGSEEV